MQPVGVAGDNLLVRRGGDVRQTRHRAQQVGRLHRLQNELHVGLVRDRAVQLHELVRQAEHEHAHGRGERLRARKLKRVLHPVDVG